MTSSRGADFLNARRTIDRPSGLRHNSHINENDAISFTEITVGDNDHLASKVCALIEADAMQLITSAKGLYDKDPTRLTPNSFLKCNSGSLSGRALGLKLTQAEAEWRARLRPLKKPWSFQ